MILSETKLRKLISKILQEHFLTEGGNAIKNSRPVSQAEARVLISWLKSNLFPLLGLREMGRDFDIIGSAGKKSEDQTSGDIDVAVSIKALKTNFGVEEHDILDVLAQKLKDIGFDIFVAKGFGQVSFGAPLSDGLVAQVDLMLTNNLDWSKFVYHSPDFSKGESKFKGVYRNLLLTAAIGNSFFEALKKNEKEEVLEYKAAVLRMNQGIVSVRKSFEGPKGLLKKAKLLAQHDELIADTPEGVMKLLFHGNLSPDAISSYEKLVDLIFSKSFKFPEKRNLIIRDFENKIQQAGLEMPAI